MPVTIDPNSIQQIPSNLAIDPNSIQKIGNDQSSDQVPQHMGIRDSIESRINDPGNVPDTGWRGTIEKIGQGAAQGLMAPVLHPLKTLGSIAEATPAGSVFDLATGRPDATQEQAKGIVNGFRKDPARATGQLIGGFAGAHVLPAMGSAEEGISNFRPTPSESIVSPEEMAARKLTSAVGPDPQRASVFIKAAQKEIPNILDYAKRQNNPLKTQLEFNKAAEGSAEEARNHYEQNVLGPNANTHVPVPEGYGGNSYTPGGENPKTTASLGDIDKRIVQINKELSGPSARLNEGDQRAALASKASLQAEHAQLTDLLHRSLSDLTGVAPEDIANLRQRVGRSRELANDTNAAVTKRDLQEGKPKAWTGIGVSHIPGKIVDMVRGGPNAIADRAFQKSIMNFNGQPEPLPQPIYPSKPLGGLPQAAPIRPIAPRPQSVEIPVINTADPAAALNTRTNNLRFGRRMQQDAQSAAEAEQARRDANYATRGTRLTALAAKKGITNPQ